MDTLTKAERSKRMSLVKATGSKPEKVVGALLRKMNVRFKKHHATLAGKPDFIIPSAKLAVFVHGCFWHRHRTCHNGRRFPKTRLQFWLPKLMANKARDARVLRELNRTGWRYLVIWECQLKSLGMLETRLRRSIAKGELH